MEEMEVRRLDGAKVPLGTVPIDLVYDVLVKHKGPFITGLLENRRISNNSRPRSGAESSSVTNPCQKPQPRHLIVI